MGLLDAISPTPRNRILGLLADATQGVNDFASKPFGYDNPPARMLMGLLGVPSIATTLDRLSYGEPLTNAGKANVPLLKPETADAAMAAAAALPAVSRGALKASDAAVRAITRNPEATATKVMDYAAQINPMNPMVVYHGSPHKFDKFDSSKIGTGEGAQAYGHGLYLAESPAVAGKYAENLGGVQGSKFSIDGKDLNLPPWVVERLQKGWATVDDVIGEFQQRAASATAAKAKSVQPWIQEEQASQAARIVSELEALRGRNLASAKQGSLYKVDLPDSAIAKMLDWDKPLSQQPAEVQDIFSGLARFGVDDPMALTGRDAYRRMHEAAIRQGKPEPAAVKEAQMVRGLRTAGIPGIRYLDGGSRGAGAGTSNFVVFPGEESLLSILERNGVPVK